MTARAPIILAVIVALLAAYTFFFERDRPTRTEIEARDGFLLPTLVQQRVTTIRISAGDQSMEMFRQGEGFDETWTLREPTEAAADPQRVADYIRNWEYTIATRTLENPSPADIHDFGLDAPKASVRFEMGQAEVSVALGSRAPVDGGGYVRLDETNRVMVVPKSVVELFEADAELFRIKNDGGAPDLADLLDAGVGEDADSDAGQDATVEAP